MTTGIRDVKEVDPVTLKDLLGEAVRGRGMAAVLAPHAPPHTAPLLAADVVALALSGIFAEAVVHLVAQHASGIAGRVAPVVLLPLVLGYWLGGLYSEVWVHPALQLKQTTHVTSLGLLAAALAG